MPHDAAPRVAVVPDAIEWVFDVSKRRSEHRDEHRAQQTEPYDCHGPRMAGSTWENAGFFFALAPSLNAVTSRPFS